MGTLYIVATPIGNLEDITVRAIKTLASVDCIACEDTRRTGLLLTSLKTFYPSYFTLTKRPEYISYFDEIEQSKAPVIVEKLERGLSIALVSDSGTPLVSDPGYKLVGEALKRNIPVVSIPGPTSLISALVVSGFPPNRFLFIGFLEKKERAKRKQLVELIKMQKSVDRAFTIIAYETEERLSETLQILQNIAGDIEIVIARELTKIHEEIWRGKLSEAKSYKFKGEIVLLFQLGTSDNRSVKASNLLGELRTN